MGGLVGNRYVSLRSQLDETGYRQAFGIESLSLVENLFFDLLKTTQQLRQCTEEATAYKKLSKELEEGVEPFKEENLRLIKENSQLRLAIQRNEEKLDEKLQGTRSKLRNLESENAELKLLITQFVERVKKQEVESLEKTRRMAQLQERNLQSNIIMTDGTTKNILYQRQLLEIDNSAPKLCPHCTRIRNFVQSGKNRDPTAIDYIKVADSRIEVLTLQNRSLKTTQQDLMELIKNMKIGIEMREAELEKMKMDIKLGVPYSRGGVEIIGSGDHDVENHPGRDLQLALKSAQLQLQLLQKRNLDLERKLQNNLLQGHDDFMLNRSRTASERHLIASLLDRDGECMFLPAESTAVEEKLRLLEAQLSHCCQEKAKLKSLLEDCERTHKKRKTTPDRDIPTDIPVPDKASKPLEDKVPKKARQVMSPSLKTTSKTIVTKSVFKHFPSVTASKKLNDFSSSKVREISRLNGRAKPKVKTSVASIPVHRRKSKNDDHLDDNSGVEEDFESLTPEHDSNFYNEDERSSLPVDGVKSIRRQPVKQSVFKSSALLSETKNDGRTDNQTVIKSLSTFRGKKSTSRPLQPEKSGELSNRGRSNSLKIHKQGSRESVATESEEESLEEDISESDLETSEAKYSQEDVPYSSAAQNNRNLKAPSLVLKHSESKLQNSNSKTKIPQSNVGIPYGLEEKGITNKATLQKQKVSKSKPQEEKNDSLDEEVETDEDNDFSSNLQHQEKPERSRSRVHSSNASLPMDSRSRPEKTVSGNTASGTSVHRRSDTSKSSKSAPDASRSREPPSSESTNQQNLNPAVRSKQSDSPKSSKTGRTGSILKPQMKPFKTDKDKGRWNVPPESDQEDIGDTSAEEDNEASDALANAGENYDEKLQDHQKLRGNQSDITLPSSVNRLSSKTKPRHELSDSPKFKNSRQRIPHDHPDIYEDEVRSDSDDQDESTDYKRDLRDNAEATSLPSKRPSTKLKEDSTIGSSLPADTSTAKYGPKSKESLKKKLVDNTQSEKRPETKDRDEDRVRTNAKKISKQRSTTDDNDRNFDDEASHSPAEIYIPIGDPLFTAEDINDIAATSPSSAVTFSKRTNRKIVGKPSKPGRDRSKSRDPDFSGNVEDRSVAYEPGANKQPKKQKSSNFKDSLPMTASTENLERRRKQPPDAEIGGSNAAFSSGLTPEQDDHSSNQPSKEDKVGIPHSRMSSKDILIDKKSDIKRPSGRRSDDKKPSDRRSDDRRSSEKRSDNKRPSGDRQDDIMADDKRSASDKKIADRSKIRDQGGSYTVLPKEVRRKSDGVSDNEDDAVEMLDEFDVDPAQENTSNSKGNSRSNSKSLYPSKSGGNDVDLKRRKESIKNSMSKIREKEYTPTPAELSQGRTKDKPQWSAYKRRSTSRDDDDDKHDRSASPNYGLPSQQDWSQQDPYKMASKPESLGPSSAFPSQAAKTHNPQESKGSLKQAFGTAPKLAASDRELFPHGGVEADIRSRKPDPVSGSGRQDYLPYGLSEERNPEEDFYRDPRTSKDSRKMPPVQPGEHGRGGGYNPYTTVPTSAPRTDNSNEVNDLYNRIRGMERVIDKLQVEADLAKASKGDLEKEVNKLRRALAECQEHGQQLRSENQKTKIILEQTQALLSETQRKSAANYIPTQRENQELNQQVRQLMAREMVMEREVAELTSTIKALDRDKDEMRVELDRKDEKLARIQAENSKHFEQLTKLQLQLKNAELQIGHTGEASRDQEREILQLKRHIDTLKSDLDARIKERDAIQRDLHRVSQSSSKTEVEKRNMTVELEKRGKESDELRKQLQKYIDEVRRIEDLLFKKEEELESLIESYSILSQEKGSLETQRNLLEREASSVRSDARDAFDSNSLLASKLTSQQSMVQIYEEEIAKLSSQVATLENQLRSSQDREKLLQVDLNSARELCLKLETKLDSMRLEVANSESAKNKLQAENSELRSNYEMLESQLSSDEENQKKLEHLLAKMRENEYQAEQVLAGITSERDMLTSRVTTLQSRTELLTAEIEKYRMKSAELQSELEKVKRQYQSEKIEREAALAELKRIQAQLSTSSTSLLMTSALAPSRTPSPSPFQPTFSGSSLLQSEVSPVAHPPPELQPRDTLIPSPVTELPL